MADRSKNGKYVAISQIKYKSDMIYNKTQS